MAGFGRGEAKGEFKMEANGKSPIDVLSRATAPSARGKILGIHLVTTCARSSFNSELRNREFAIAKSRTRHELHMHARMFTNRRTIRIRPIAVANTCHPVGPLARGFRETRRRERLIAARTQRLASVDSIVRARYRCNIRR